MLQKKKMKVIAYILLSHSFCSCSGRFSPEIRPEFARYSPEIRRTFARNSPHVRRRRMIYKPQQATQTNKLGARCRPFLLRRVSSSPVPLGRRLNSFSRRNGLRFLSIHYSATGRRQIQFPLLSTLVLRYLFTLFTFLLFFFFSISFLFPA